MTYEIFCIDLTSMLKFEVVGQGRRPVLFVTDTYVIVRDRGRAVGGSSVILTHS